MQKKKTHEDYEKIVRKIIINNNKKDIKIYFNRLCKLKSYEIKPANGFII